MKRKNILMLGMTCLMLLSGCTGKNHDLLTGSENNTLLTGSENSDFLTESGSESGDSESGQGSEKDDVSTKQESEDDNSQKNQESAGDVKETETIFVYVCGCVVNPAVYEINADARIYEAIELAGGFSGDAAVSALNLAENMVDGQKIYVPSVEEQMSSGGQEAGSGEVSSGGQPVTAESGLVNLNTATKEQLMTLSGIGEAKADSILSYREEHGAFSSIEDIMKIEGIKEGVFNKIKDKITV